MWLSPILVCRSYHSAGVALGRSIDSSAAPGRALGAITGRTAVLGLVLGLHVAIPDPGLPELSLRWRCARAIHRFFGRAWPGARRYNRANGRPWAGSWSACGYPRSWSAGAITPLALRSGDPSILRPRLAGRSAL